MKYLSNFALSRVPVLKSIFILIFMIIICPMIGPGNYAFPDEGAFFSIHLYSFKGMDEAKAKVEEFIDLGYNAFYRQESTDDRTDVYNVYIERFNTMSEAEKEANILKELDLISGYEIREIIEKTKIASKNEKQAPEPENKDIKDYYLKISSLRQRENAEGLVKRLKDAGYNAFYNYEAVEGKGNWYRVYIDEYKTKGDAEKDAKKLMQSGIISDFEINHATEDIHAAEKARKDETKVYSLHIASYRESSNADDDILRLSSSGLKAFSVKTDISGEQWFRVYVGEFSDEEAAIKTGEELLKNGIITYFKPMIIGKSDE